MRQIFFALCAFFLVTMTATAASHDEFHTALFNDKNGHIRRLRLPQEGDFSNELITQKLKKEKIEEYRNRLQDNQAGIFIIESEASEIISHLLTGRMPLGYQPWPPTNEDDKMRSNVILSFYEALLTSIGHPLDLTKKHRLGGMDLVHINPSVLALAVVLEGDFCTTSAQEAAVHLVRANNMMVIRDHGVTEPGIPLLCISITQEEGLMSTDITKAYPGLPYYPPSHKEGGLYYAAVTPMTSHAVVLPEPGNYPLKDFSSLPFKG